ncbi:MAG: hypothetical protein ACYTDT_09990 [Planctomycetota bacterium]|jgi:hypothetical protein
MKPALAAFTVLLSVGGGFVAGIMGPELMEDKADDAPVVAKSMAPAEVAEYDDSGLKEELQRIRSDNDAMKLNLENRIADVEADNASLRKSNKDLNNEVTTLKSNKPVDSGTVEAAEMPTEGTSDFDEAVAKAIEKKTEEDRQKRNEERTKRMADMMESAQTRTLNSLTEQLSLDVVQQENVKKILSDMNTKRTEVATKGRQAMQNGEEFDWRGEMSAVSDEAKESIKSELSSSQLSTFNQLEEEGKIDVSGFGGMGGMGRRR